MSGMLNVVLPSPAPYVVPIAERSAAYVVRDTAEPSQMSQPVGAALPANCAMAPEGTPCGTGGTAQVPSPRAKSVVSFGMLSFVSAMAALGEMSPFTMDSASASFVYPIAAVGSMFASLSSPYVHAPAPSAMAR